MTNVAEMNIALEIYLDAIRADYSRWSNMTADEDSRAIRERMTDEFHKGLQVNAGKSYLKVIAKTGSSRSVHSFIVLEDGPRFKRGDILKPAGWQGPAKNSARGNIFGTYHIQWTGPEYLR